VKTDNCVIRFSIEFSENIIHGKSRARFALIFIFYQIAWKSQKLTQNVFRSQLVEIAELVVAVKHGGASNNRHEDHIGRDVLSFESIAGLTPTVTDWLKCWLISHQRVAVGAGAALVDTEHAGGEGDESHDHFPRMRGAKFAMSTKQTARLDHVNDLSVESVSN
jgi:hypothetical protein